MKLKNSFIYLLFLTPYLFVFIKSAGFRCNQILNNDAFFSLESLALSKDYTYIETINLKAYRLYYNFCTLTERKCKGQSAYAMIFPLENDKEQDEQCVLLTSSSILSNFAYELNDPDDASAGITLIMTNGDKYQDSETKKYEIEFKIECTKSKLPLPFVLDEMTKDENKYLVIGRSNYACPLVQFSDVYNFIVDNKYIFGILSIIFGGIECFFGLALLKPSMFIIGYLSGFGFLILIFSEFILTPDSNIILIWVMLLIAVMIGAFAGYIATSLPKIGFMGLGLWLGFVLAFTLNNLFLYKIEVNPPELPLYLFMGLFGIIFMILSMCMWRHICIVATSFLGAYLVIRSLSLYIGYYPNELTLSRQIKYKELEGVGWEFYIYFIALMILTALGMIIQFKNKRELGGKYAGIYDEETLVSPSSLNNDYVEMKVLENLEEKSRKSGKEEDLENLNNEEDNNKLNKSKKNSQISQKNSQISNKKQKDNEDNLLEEEKEDININKINKKTKKSESGSGSGEDSDSDDSESNNKKNKKKLKEFKKHK